MAASGSDSDLNDTSATGLFNFAAAKISEGWSLDKFLKTGLGLTIAGTFVGIQRVFNAIINFVTEPLSSAGNSVATLFEGLVAEPASILTSTAGTTSTEISTTFTGWMGPFAFPVGVGSVMLALWLVTVYLEERETSDLFPGSFTDFDVPDALSSIIPDPGVSEQGEDDSRD